jgi:hypothetical protein
VKSIAHLISVLLHPLLMATYGCLLLFFGITDTVYDYLTPFDIKWRITGIVFIFSFIFPVLNIFLLYQMKKVPDLTLSNRRDRTFPYVMTSVFYFGLFYLLMDVNIWPSIKLFIAGGGFGILLTAIINFRSKISAHMVGMGGLLGVIVSVSYLIRFDMTLYFVLIIIAAGLVGFSRLVLEQHKPSQIYTGFLLGFALQLGLFFSLQKLIFA